MTAPANPPPIKLTPAPQAVTAPQVADVPAPKAAVQPLAITVQSPPDDHLWDYINTGVSGGVGLIAAVIGAVLGYHLTKKSNDEARERDSRAQNAFASFALLQKITKIYSALNATKQHFEQAIAEAKAKNSPHPSLSARAHLNRLPSVEFSLDELYRTAKLTDPSFINSVMLLDDHHNFKMEMSEKYSEAKISFDRKMKGKVVGSVMNIGWTEEEYGELQPELVGLDMMIFAILDKIDDDRARAHDAIIALHKATGKYLNRQTKIELIDLAGVKQIIPALDDEPKK